MGLLLDIRSGAPSTRPAGSRLEGTTWQFGGSDTTVQFLAGGRVRFSNSDTGGQWEQNGNAVKFDANNYTLFEVTVTGDEMTGTWRRLQGPDVGMESPTSLRRVTAGVRR